MNATEREWPVRRIGPSSDPRDNIIELANRRGGLHRGSLLHGECHGVVWPLLEGLEMTCVRSDEVAS
jgi:hypothetical protein